MAASHRPDAEAYFKEKARRLREKPTIYRKAYMWPYINQGDLSEGKLFLLFVNLRGCNSPEVFARSDFETMHCA